MNTPTSWPLFWCSLVVLLVVHSLVSFCAYRWLVKTTVLGETKLTNEEPMIETTSSEEARGERSFSTASVSLVAEQVEMSTVVIFYVWGGYLGLGVAALVSLITWLRHG